jgi:hypothetical protein
MRERWTEECEPLTPTPHKMGASGWFENSDGNGRDCNVHKVDHPNRLSEFCLEVQKAFPLCKFAEHQAGRLWVYHPNKPLCMGWIGYDDFRSGHHENKKRTYGVCSRLIQNMKYGSHNEQRNMAMSADLEVATRKAKKFLRDYKVTEIAGINGYACRSKWGETDTDLTRKIRRARDEIADFHVNDLLHRELEVLVAAGHKFLHPEFNEKVLEFLAAHEEKKEALSGRTKRMLMVCVEQTLYGNTLYCMASTEDISEWTPDWVPQETCTEETLPSEIAGPLSVLNMCDHGQYVDGVGYKATESCFYVVR